MAHSPRQSIEGFFQQQGTRDSFSLKPVGPQSGNAPTGRWTGSLKSIGLKFEVTFKGTLDNLTATLDSADENIVGQTLSHVALDVARPIGKRVTERIVPLGDIQAYTDVRKWGEHQVQIDIVFNRSGEIQSLEAYPVPPLSPDPGACHKSKVAYRIPWEGAWFVFWGETRDS